MNILTSGRTNLDIKVYGELVTGPGADLPAVYPGDDSIWSWNQSRIPWQRPRPSSLSSPRDGLSPPEGPPWFDCDGSDTTKGSRHGVEPDTGEVSLPKLQSFNLQRAIFHGRTRTAWND